MKFTCIFTGQAQDDLITSVLFEEERHASLGKKFLDCVTETAETICKSPLGYENKYKSTREKKVNKFPYLLIYTVEKNIVYVHAIFPAKQNPEKKYGSL